MIHLANIKKKAFHYLKVSLSGLIPIPFIVIALSFFDFSQSTILIISFLCSVATIEYLRFNHYHSPLSNQVSFDLFAIKQTEVFTYGAIEAKIDKDDLFSSLKVEEKGSETYDWASSQ